MPRLIIRCGVNLNCLCQIGSQAGVIYTTGPKSCQAYFYHFVGHFFAIITLFLPLCLAS